MNKPLWFIFVFLATGLNLRADAQLRVNQAGYLVNGGKQALLMATGSESNATFQVVRSDNTVAFAAPVGNSIGSWNQAYTHVYRLDFSDMTNSGTYSIKVTGNVSAVSPSFRIGSGREIFHPLLRNALYFFKAQRDGPDVSSNVLGRQPSHLADKQAFVFKAPAFGKNGMQGALEKIGGPVDVTGGWFDAGDYLKFVETASYVTAVMLQSARDNPVQTGRGAELDFAAEGRYGLDWLLKMWNDDTRTLYVQVGIGESGRNITGDHDLWRLPEADDKLRVTPGDPSYFIKHRPVFKSDFADSKISPNLAGRLAAAFALGYQVFNTSDPVYAQKLLLAAEHVFERAGATNVTILTSTFPHEYYPEEEWRDDMEWGATELCLALANGQSSNSFPAQAKDYLTRAAHWARAGLQSGSEDFPNLYDVSGIAHFELCRAIEKAGEPKGLEVTRAELLARLKKQLDGAVKRSEKDPFGLGVRYTGGDLVPRVLGLILVAGFYDELTQTRTYDGLAQRQMDFVLGANPWGTSFIVGAGTIFPRHVHHQIANLAGSLDGTPPILLGAAVNGPARGKSKSDAPDGARPTPWPGGKNPFDAFSGSGVRYVDDVSSWETVEPADDYTIPSVLIFAWFAGR